MNFNIIKHTVTKESFSYSAMSKKIFADKIKPALKFSEMKSIHLQDDDYIHSMGISISYEYEDEIIFNLDIEYSAIFSIVDESENFQENLNLVTNIHIPNYIYPYIRVYVDNIISRTGLPNINLPLMNFSAVYLNKQNEQNKKAS